MNIDMPWSLAAEIGSVVYAFNADRAGPSADDTRIAYTLGHLSTAYLS
jgi:hypothetical protein